MALNGTLADLGIVDLIQFPNKGRRSGELVLAGQEEEARLYYVEGNLTHVQMGDLRGIDALVEVVSWTDGEFEFRTGVENDSKTVELDLHRALMVALKIRDERVEEMRKNKNRAETPRTDENMTARAIRGIMGKSPFIQGICVFLPDGAVVAELESDDVPERGRFQRVRESIVSLYLQYTDNGLSRAFLEDDMSVLHGARIADNSVAVIAANRETSMGQLSLIMNRLISTIEGTGA